MSTTFTCTLVRIALGALLITAGPNLRAEERDESLQSEDAAYSIFLLVKTTPDWLALAPESRFDWLDSTIEPLLESHPEVSMRFWDVEHFSAETSDVILFETQRLDRYMSLIEKMRETAFWDRYFIVQSILPGIENAYAEAYDRDAY